MGKTRESGNLVSKNNIFSNITNDRVGISTISPNSRLDVNGEITLSTSPFLRNIPTISSNYTITPTYNEMSIGPIAINSGITVTVQSGATWTIV
jgi:hypothetical protein